MLADLVSRRRRKVACRRVTKGALKSREPTRIHAHAEVFSSQEQETPRVTWPEALSAVGDPGVRRMVLKNDPARVRLVVGPVVPVPVFQARRDQKRPDRSHKGSVHATQLGLNERFDVGLLEQWVHQFG